MGTEKKDDISNWEKEYRKLLPNIRKIYSKYSYLGLDLDDYNSQIFAIFQRKKKELSNQDLNQEEFRCLFEKGIDNFFNTIVAVSLNDEEKGLTVINNYINTKLANAKDYLTAINEIKKLSSFFSKNNYFISPDLCMELIKKNEKIKAILKKIVDKDIDVIKQGRIDDLFSDITLVSFIEGFCIVNDITVLEDDVDLSELYTGLNNNKDLSVFLGDGLGMYLHEARQKLLTPEEEKIITLRIMKGDERAKQILIERNLMLVVSQAKRKIGRGLDFLDLIQEGNIGLMKAAERFDPTKGHRFSTYAVWWIRQSVSRAIAEKSRNIRMPVHMHEALSKISRAKEELEFRLKREPTIAEIAYEVGLKPEKVMEYMALISTEVSINTLIGDEKETELGDFIADEDAYVEEIYINNNLSEEIRQLLIKCNLKEREMAIIIRRFGLNGRDPETLASISETYNMTRERVRQIEKKAIRKIRNSSHIKAFANYMNNPTRALESLGKARKKSYDEVITKTTTKKDTKSEDKVTLLSKLNSGEVIFTREQVDVVLKMLTYKERNTLKLQFGENLDTQIRTYFYDESIKNRINLTLSKMKTLLYQYYPNGNKDEILEDKNVNDQTREIYDLFLKCDLKEREIDVVTSLFGLCGKKEETIRQIALNTGYTSAGVKKIEKRALAKIEKTQYKEEFISHITDPEKAAIVRKKLEESKEEEHEQKSPNVNGWNTKYYSLYERLNDGDKKYSKEVIDGIISSLRPDEIELLTSRYGEDFNELLPLTDPSGKKNSALSNIILKINRKLNKLSSQGEKDGTASLESSETVISLPFDKKIDEEALEDKEKDILPEGIILEDSKEEDNLVAMSSEEVNISLTEPVMEIIEHKIDESSDAVNIESYGLEEFCDESQEIEFRKKYVATMELLKTDMFYHSLDTLSLKEALVVSLALWCNTDIKSVIGSISKLIEVEEQEVIDITKNALLKYREYGVKLIDEIKENVESRTDQEGGKQYKKIPGHNIGGQNE